MAKISDTHASVKADLAASQASLDNLAADMSALDAKITELQNNPGPISPEDQALLDEMQTLAASLKARTQTLAEVHPEPVVEPLPPI